MIEKTKKDLVICKLLLSEIKIYADRVFLEKKRDEVKNPANKLITMSVFLKGLCIQLNNLADVIDRNVFNEYISENNNLIEINRKLKKDLPFIKHIRNHICGHLDDEVIEKLIQWEPGIFEKRYCSKEFTQEYLIYKSILETGINSYITEEGTQKVFNREIDLFIPEENEMFMKFLGETTDKAVDFLSIIALIVNQKITYYSYEELLPDSDWSSDNFLPMIKEAAQTDFKLKKKGR